MKSVTHTHFEFALPTGDALTFTDPRAAKWLKDLIDDAERYRWLKATDPMNLCFIAWRVPEATCEKWANNPDKAIDKARGK